MTAEGEEVEGDEEEVDGEAVDEETPDDEAAADDGDAAEADGDAAADDATADDATADSTTDDNATTDDAPADTQTTGDGEADTEDQTQADEATGDGDPNDPPSIETEGGTTIITDDIDRVEEGCPEGEECPDEDAEDLEEPEEEDQIVVIDYLGPKPFMFELVDRGYPVWMMNQRGTEYSRQHSQFEAETEAFQDFDLFDLWIDIKANIDIIKSYLGY